MARLKKSVSVDEFLSLYYYSDPFRDAIGRLMMCFGHNGSNHIDGDIYDNSGYRIQTVSPVFYQYRDKMRECRGLIRPDLSAHQKDQIANTSSYDACFAIVFGAWWGLSEAQIDKAVECGYPLSGLHYFLKNPKAEEIPKEEISFLDYGNAESVLTYKVPAGLTNDAKSAIYYDLIRTLYPTWGNVQMLERDGALAGLLIKLAGSPISLLLRIEPLDYGNFMRAIFEFPEILDPFTSFWYKQSAVRFRGGFPFHVVTNGLTRIDLEEVIHSYWETVKEYFNPSFPAGVDLAIRDASLYDEVLQCWCQANGYRIIPFEEQCSIPVEEPFVRAIQKGNSLEAWIIDILCRYWKPMAEEAEKSIAEGGRFIEEDTINLKGYNTALKMREELFSKHEEE